MAQINTVSGNVMCFAGSKITSSGGETFSISNRKVVSSGDVIILEDNTEYKLTDVTRLDVYYPPFDDFEVWMRIDTAVEGDIVITFPSPFFLGPKPVFGNGQTWEISIKNGIIAAAQVVRM